MDITGWPLLFTLN
jgi:hypothetical protein